MQEIFCNIQPFIFKQQIYKVDTETGEQELLGSCNFGDLIDTLEAIMRDQQIYTLHLAGNDVFIEALGSKINTDFHLKYSDSVNIEVKYN